MGKRQITFGESRSNIRPAIVSMSLDLVKGAQVIAT